MALDVYEHAYFLDYRTDRSAYIDAFFENLDWGTVNDWVSKYAIPLEVAIETLAFIVVGYLAGSLPFGYWVVRLDARRRHPDGRQREHRGDERLAELRPRATRSR